MSTKQNKYSLRTKSQVSNMAKRFRKIWIQNFWYLSTMITLATVVRIKCWEKIGWHRSRKKYSGEWKKELCEWKKELYYLKRLWYRVLFWFCVCFFLSALFICIVTRACSKRNQQEAEVRLWGERKISKLGLLRDIYI